MACHIRPTHPRAGRRHWLAMLVTDTRGVGIGFPPQVFEQPTFLNDRILQIRHQDADHVDIDMDSFRYSVYPDKEPRF